MNISLLLKDIGVKTMSKGYSYYYRLECYEGFRDGAVYEDKSFGGLYKKFTGCRHRVKGDYIKNFIEMYDKGFTGAYYNIHCVFVYPDGSEKIIYTCRGL